MVMWSRVRPPGASESSGSPKDPTGSSTSRGKGRGGTAREDSNCAGGTVRAAGRSEQPTTRSEVEVAPKTCTPAEAAAVLRPRDTVGFGLGPGNPGAFFAALGGSEDWDRLLLRGPPPPGYYDVFTKPGVSYRCGFFGP